jgi:hypothetical protein
VVLIVGINEARKHMIGPSAAEARRGRGLGCGVWGLGFRV